MAQLERVDIEGFEHFYVFLQDNSNKWLARFKLDNDPSKKWYCKTTGQEDLEDARVEAKFIRREFQSKLNEGTLVKNKSFKEVAELAIADMKQKIDAGTGKVVFKDYIGVLRKYHIEFFAKTSITSIKRAQLKEFDNWRFKKAGKTLSKSTILNHNAALQRVFEFALDNEWMLPIQVPKLTNDGESGHRRLSFTPEEYDQICEEVLRLEQNSRKKVTAEIRRLLYYYMEFAINTGLRPGTELDNLKWGDLHIQTQGHQARFYLNVRKGKTTKFTGTREVVCNANIYDAIWLLTRDFPERKPNDLIFRLKSGKQTKELGRTFALALENIGLKKPKTEKGEQDNSSGERTLYSLRHSYITWELRAQRVPIEVLAKQCGTSISMIEQHYSHVVPKMYSNQLSGLELDEVQQIKNRFALSNEKAIESYSRRAKEWAANYKRRGCI